MPRQCEITMTLLVQLAIARTKNAKETGPRAQ